MKTEIIDQLDPRGKNQDKILFKHYQYRSGSEYIDIIMAMQEYAAWCVKKALNQKTK